MQNKSGQKGTQQNIAALLIVVALIFLLLGTIIGICVYYVIDRYGEVQEETVVGEKVDFLSVTVDETMESDENEENKETEGTFPEKNSYWQPPSVELDYGFSVLGDRVFYRDTDSIDVYDKELNMIAQLTNARVEHVIQAVTDGEYVYMLAYDGLENSVDDVIVWWNIDMDQVVYMEPVYMYPNIPTVRMTGVNENGAYYFVSENSPTVNARWYRCTPKEVVDLGVFSAAPQYIGEGFVVAKTSTFGVNWTEDGLGKLSVVYDDSRQLNTIAEKVTKFKVYENKIYYLDNPTDDERSVFCCYDVKEKTNSVLSEPIVVTDFELIHGGIGAIFVGETENEYSHRGFIYAINFASGDIKLLVKENIGIKVGGRNGYFVSEDENNIYMYNMKTRLCESIYKAEEGWRVRYLQEDKDCLYIGLINRANYEMEQLEKIELDVWQTEEYEN